MPPPLVIAHRTCPPYAPENSLRGLRVAADQGADGVEVDVRTTLDQRTFLMHDNSMWRTTRWPLPIELTPSFLARRQRLEGSDETVPSLAEAIAALPPGLLLAADVKTPTAIVPLLRQLRRAGLSDRTLVWCSSALVVRYAARTAPEVEVAHYKDIAGAQENIDFVARARSLGARAVSLSWAAIGTSVVAAAHALGLRVYSWHMEHELTREKLATGLDGIITDHPARVRDAVAALLA